MRNKLLNKKFEGLIQPEDYKLIPLTQGKFTKVDNEDFDKVRGFNWNYSKMGTGYSNNHRLGLMHRYIMNAPKGKVVDHINHDTLDNRKSNLRICTQLENNANQRPYENSSSKYKGVSWDRENNKWRASTHWGGVNKSLGRYEKEEEAGVAYDLEAIHRQGDFAYLNFPEKKEEYLKITNRMKKSL